MRRIALAACCMFALAAAGAWMEREAILDLIRPRDIPLPDLDRVRTVDLGGHTQEVGCAAFSRDGKLVATGCEDGKVRVFDVASAKVLQTIAFGEDQDNKPDELGARARGRQDRVAFDHEGKKLVAVGGDSSSSESFATVFDLITKKPVFTSRAQQMIWGAAFSPDGKVLVTAEHDSTLRVFDATTGKERGTFEGHDWVVTAVTFSPDGETVASVCCNSIKRSIKFWGPLDLRESLNVPLPSRIYSIDDLAFSPDGKQIAGVSNWRFHAWEAATGKRLANAALESGLFTRLAYSPDGKRVAIAGKQGGEKGILRLYDFTTQKVYLVFVEDVGKELRAVSWPVADTILAVGVRGKGVKLVTVQLRS